MGGVRGPSLAVAALGKGLDRCDSHRLSPTTFVTVSRLQCFTFGDGWRSSLVRVRAGPVAIEDPIPILTLPRENDQWPDGGVMSVGLRPGLRIRAGWGLALMLILALGVSPQTAQRPQLVLAVYVASYDWRSWSEGLCDVPPVPYTSADAVTLGHHVRQAKEAGIDGFVVKWWGPNPTNNPTEGALVSLMEVSQTAAFRITVLLDLTRPEFESVEAVEAALVALGTRHMPRDAYLRLGGRPVVFLRRASRISLPAWEALRNRLDPHHVQIWMADTVSQDALRVFDGAFLFDPTASEVLTETLQRAGAMVRQWGIDHGSWRYWVAPVMPGCGLCGNVQCPRDALAERLDGQVYRSQWAAAVASDPDWVLLRSFNEWTCCTQIEPGLTYGTLYLDITRQMVDQYMEMSTQPFTPTPGQSPPETPSPRASLPIDGAATPILSPIASPEAAPTPEGAGYSVLPTPTRFLLPTPTPTFDRALPLQTEATLEEPIYRATPPLRRALSTPTPLPSYLPVEGARASRCLWLPLILVMLVLWLGRDAGWG